MAQETISAPMSGGHSASYLTVKTYARTGGETVICRGHFAPEPKRSHTIWILRSKLRKLLGEEKRSCHTEGEKLKEVHQLFEQVRQSVFGYIFAVFSYVF